MQGAIRAAIHNFNPDQRIGGNKIQTLEGALSVQTIWVPQHLFSVLFGFFGVLALFLSLVGIASTVYFAASRRRNELGIRIALGANRNHIVWTVSRPILTTLAYGMAAGLFLNMFARTWLEHWIAGNNTSMWAFVPACTVLVVSAVAACMIPAIRAAYVDPTEALRSE
jgi:ABC-type antimicrobial peptide transport system permease subunit